MESKGLASFLICISISLVLSNEAPLTTPYTVTKSRLAFFSLLEGTVIQELFNNCIKENILCHELFKIGSFVTMRFRNTSSVWPDFGSHFFAVNILLHYLMVLLWFPCNLNCNTSQCPALIQWIYNTNIFFIQRMNCKSKSTGSTVLVANINCFKHTSSIYSH